MHTQSGNSWQIIFEPQESELPALDNFMEIFFPASACDYTDDGKLIYTGYSSTPVDQTEMKHVAQICGISLPPYKSEFIPATNWLTKNVIRFPPLETEDFYIYGTHEENIPNTDKHQLKIYAATAFGSGQHQTTHCCLKLLSRLYHQGFHPQKILDMGCGSGILALSALRLWNTAQAVGADIDNEAVIVTLQNAETNGLSDRISAATGDGYQNNTVLHNAPYDLIFSNILARPLIEMAPALSTALRPGGYAILSGFVDEQSEWVLSAHNDQGLEPVATVGIDNWRATLVEKK